MSIKFSEGVRVTNTNNMSPELTFYTGLKLAVFDSRHYHEEERRSKRKYQCRNWQCEVLLRLSQTYMFLDVAIANFLK